jgi:hypothetical protein
MADVIHPLPKGTKVAFDYFSPEEDFWDAFQISGRGIILNNQGKSYRLKLVDSNDEEWPPGQQLIIPYSAVLSVISN